MSFYSISSSDDNRYNNNTHNINNASINNNNNNHNILNDNYQQKEWEEYFDKGITPIDTQHTRFRNISYSSHFSGNIIKVINEQPTKKQEMLQFVEVADNGFEHTSTRDALQITDNNMPLMMEKDMMINIRNGLGRLKPRYSTWIIFLQSINDVGNRYMESKRIKTGIMLSDEFRAKWIKNVNQRECLPVQPLPSKDKKINVLNGDMLLDAFGELRNIS